MRVVDPDERDVVVERVEIGQEAVLARERQRLHPGAGEERAALVHRVRGLAVRHDALLGCGSTSTCASEKIASFEP